MYRWRDDLRQTSAARVVGVDAARCIALLGMMATHMLPEDRVLHEVSAGRAAALFAVLAGVSLALMTGGTRRHRGAPLAADAAGLAVRALLIAVIGLWLGGLGTRVAVILTYYGVLFLLGLPFLALGVRSLLTLAGAWCVLSPVVSHLVRLHLADVGPLVPTTADLAHPGALLTQLAFTGYYPAVPWLTYLLAGMALGRLEMHRPLIALRVAVGGAALALLAQLGSALVLATGPARRALTASPATSGSTWEQVHESIRVSWYGTTPEDSPWWLGIVEPHTTTPFDLAHTTGTAYLVIGVFLLVTRWSPRAWAIALGAGAMTLTLYSAHVVMLQPDVWPADGPDQFPTQVLLVLAVGAVFAAARLRGPLELVVRLASATTRDAVRSLQREASARTGREESPRRTP